MNDKKLDQFIEDGIKEIDSEIKAEDDIRDQAEYLARMLAVTPVIKANINERIYVLTMRMVKDSTGRQIIMLAAEDEAKKLVYGNKYSPALLTAEFNDYFTLEENCQTLLIRKTFNSLVHLLAFF